MGVGRPRALINPVARIRSGASANMVGAALSASPRGRTVLSAVSPGGATRSAAPPRLGPAVG
eukprot:9563195-Alexandrium_andersonii.AAC.1